MSSKKKLLRKIKAGLVAAPEGWEQFAPTVSTPTQETIAATVIVVPPIMEKPAPVDVTETSRPTTRATRKTKATTKRTKRKGPRANKKE